MHFRRSSLTQQFSLGTISHISMNFRYQATPEIVFGHYKSIEKHFEKPLQMAQ